LAFPPRSSRLRAEFRTGRRAGEIGRARNDLRNPTRSDHEDAVSTILHLPLALALTLFLAYQAGAVLFVLRSRRALAAGRRRRGTEVLWTVIPVVVVLFLAARSWVAVFDVERPAIASAVVTPAPAPASLHR